MSFWRDQRVAVTGRETSIATAVEWYHSTRAGLRVPAQTAAT